MKDASFAPGNMASAGTEVPKGPGNDGPIPFDRKGRVMPSGKGWDSIKGGIKGLGGSPGMGKGMTVNDGGY